MNPRNIGIIENADGIGQVGNPQCGDIMKMYLKIEEGIIIEAKFKTFGCGAAVATSSMSTELIKGRTVEEALKVTNAAVAEALDGLPPIKMHCSALAEEAIKSAIDNYKGRNGLVAEKCDSNDYGKRCCELYQYEEDE
jgi:nitrogen fixation NifU-like protein